MPSPILSLASKTARMLPAPLRRSLYRLGPLTRLLRGTLNQLAPSGLTEVEIAAGAAQGMRMRLDLQAEKDYWLGTYELDLQAAIQHLVHPGMTTYDVGANIGFVSLMLAQASGDSGRVIAFEALPANLDRLRANISLNDLQDRISWVHAAVIDRDSPVEFLVHASASMGKAAGSAGRQHGEHETIRVPGLSLDHFVFETGGPPPDLIKLDVEGGEVLALPGMRQLLSEIRPTLLLEVHGERAAQLAWDLLTGLGYRLYRMAAGYQPVQSAAQLEAKAYLVAKAS